MLNKIIIPRAKCGYAFAASLLRFIGICRTSLNISNMGNCNNNILFGN